MTHMFLFAAFFVCAMSVTQLYSSGENTYGTLGIPHTVDHIFTMTPVPKMNSVVSVVGGDAFAVALLEDGTLRSTGANSNGRLGINSPNENFNSVAFIPVLAITGAVEVKIAVNHALVVTSSSELWVWGANYDSNLIFCSFCSMFGNRR
jgi:alpha-tubulin suppressor-like RCC1 family protein